MKEKIIFWLKIPIWFLVGLILLIVVYLLAAIGLSCIPVNNTAKQQGDIEIFLETNGVHTDLVLPVRNAWKDWSKEILVTQTMGKRKDLSYLAFGWGDKGFYMDTPEWSDLKFKTAFNAIFGLGESAVHTLYYPKPAVGKDCKNIKLTSGQYLELVRFIEKSFKRDQDKRVIFIQTRAVYGPNDAFYEAGGHYNLFNTCNSWTNKALKTCHQKACWWTPFDWPLMQKYP